MLAWTTRRVDSVQQPIQPTILLSTTKRRTSEIDHRLSSLGLASYWFGTLPTPSTYGMLVDDVVTYGCLTRHRGSSNQAMISLG